MKRVYFLAFLLIFIISNASGEKDWDTSLVADSLKEDADAVIRHFVTRYERTSIDKYQKEVHLVVTILNEAGESNATLFLHYDRNSEVTEIEGNIYDKNGQHLKKIKKKDVDDRAYSNSYTLFSDNRIKHYSPSMSSYPYTVEYNYTIENKSVVGFSDWIPNEWFDTSVEHAELIFETPSNLELKFKELNGPFEFKSKKSDETVRYEWSLEGKKAFKYEASSPPYYEILPSVLLSPTQISYEGYQGDFSTWNTLGDWIVELMENRGELPPETILEIKKLTDSLPTKKEKVKALYQYMQNKTRYVNIALGIGGYQPFPASQVDEKGYGDCKALSNYMRSLLQGVNIDSYYTVIGNGDYKKIRYPDFTSIYQTNHIILCVPAETDTIWLECTSQNYPFGYIGSSNSNRYGLLVDEQGGKLAKTPTYSSEMNCRNSNIATELLANGEMNFHAYSSFHNYLFEKVFSLVLMSKDDQKKALLRSLSADGLVIDHFDIQHTSKDKASAEVEISGRINNGTTQTGNRLFVAPNFLFNNAYPSKLKKDREYNLYLADGFTYNDSISINLPENYELEYLPKNLEINSILGVYRLTYKELNDHHIKIERSVQINPGNYEKAKFEEIDLFLRTCRNKEIEKIVLKKKSI